MYINCLFFLSSQGKRGPKGERGDPGKAHPGPPGLPGIQGNVLTLNNCNWDVATILYSQQQKVKLNFEALQKVAYTSSEQGM